MNYTNEISPAELENFKQIPPDSGEVIQTSYHSVSINFTVPAGMGVEEVLVRLKPEFKY